MNVLACDTEGTGLNPWPSIMHTRKGGWYPRDVHPARPFAFSFCDDDGETFYYRWEVDPFTRRILPNGPGRERMQHHFGNAKVPKVFHNAVYDLRMLELSGFHLAGDIHDTMIMAHVVTGGGEMSYALKKLATKYLEIDDADQKALKASVNAARRVGKKKGWALAPEPEADYWMGDRILCKKYAILDAERCMLLYHLFWPQLEADPQLMDVYRREMTLMRVLMDMEARGIRIYPERIKKMRDEYIHEQARWSKRIQKLAPGLNPKSHKQLSHELFIKRKLQPIKLTKAGNAACDGESLTHFADGGDELCAAVLEHNACKTALSNYCDAYESFRSPDPEGDCWALHPTYRQVGTNTGRMSCVDPNMMGVASSTTSRRYAKTRLFPRRMLGPRPGHVLYLMDFSQVEVWVFAFCAQYEVMTDALLKGYDFHSYISEFVFGDKPDFVQEKEHYRKSSKMAQFCKLYGGGTKALARNLHVAFEVAQRVNADYDKRLPGVKQYMEKVQRQARLDGGIRNPFGRYVQIDPGFEYRGVNYIVQGTAAEVMKDGLIEMHRRCREHWESRVHLLLTIHDEVVAEVPREFHSKALMRDLVEGMQIGSARAGVPVPLPVGIKVATDNWEDAKKVEL